MVAFLVVLGVPLEAWAGPGGSIVKATFTNPIARIVIGLVVLLLLPLIFYVLLREWLKARATRRQLRELANSYPWFDWKRIEMRADQAVRVLHHHWTSGDISAAAGYLTEDFFDSQTALLARWADEGRRNVTLLRRIFRIRPLKLHTGDDETLPHVWVSVDLEVEDYLEDVATRNVLKGKRGRDVEDERLYLMVYEDDWRVAAIEDGGSSLTIATEKNVIDRDALRQRFGVTAAQPTRAASPDAEEDSGREHDAGS